IFLYLFLFFFFFFFFQAEDGIRDLIVTGVQTCALPISQAMIVQVLLATLIWAIGAGAIGWAILFALHRSGLQQLSEMNPSAEQRSSKRRVGKECRSRWVRDQ